MKVYVVVEVYEDDGYEREEKILGVYASREKAIDDVMSIERNERWNEETVSGNGDRIRSWEHIEKYGDECVCSEAMDWYAVEYEVIA